MKKKVSNPPCKCADCKNVEFWKSTTKPRVIACKFRQYSEDGEVADAMRVCDKFQLNVPDFIDNLF